MMTEERWNRLMGIVKFVLCVAASFGSGYATAVLTEVTAAKAIASGIVTACAYILGNQQAPAPLITKK